MKRFLSTIILTAVCGIVFSQNIGVGKWRNHFSYAKIYKTVVVHNRVYAQAKLGLFFYDIDDGSINKLSKIEGLSDVGISTIAYDKQTNCLAIAYKNSNIDLIINDVIYNISDIKRKEISGDKAIYNISFHAGKAYLSCGFGIAVVNIARKEISDVYYLGENGTYIKINDVAFTNTDIVAGTDNGILRISKENPFPNIAGNWSLEMAAEQIVDLDVCNNTLLITVINNAETSSIYTHTPEGQYLLWFSGNIKSVSVSEKNVTISEYSHVNIYNHNLELQSTVSSANEPWFEMAALYATVGHDNELWIGHDWGGMILYPNYNSGNIMPIMPNGPENDDVYNLSGYGNGVLLSPGSRRGDYFVEANVATFQNNEWINLNGSLCKDTSWNILDVVIDPANKKKMFAASWRNGVLEIDNNTAINVYNYANTDGALTPYISGNYYSMRIGACAADNKKNIWFTNSLNKNGLAVRRKDGSWQAFNTQNLVTDEIYRLMIDSLYWYKWFYGQGNRIYVHDGENRMAYINSNNGSKLETSTVNCLVQDHTNELWIGTDKGIKVIYNTSNAFANGGHSEMAPISCNNILYSEDGKVEYLLAYENISCIAVDGGNRKWIGTAAGGIFLLSDNGLEQLEHFTANNSPLPSDKITAIGIAPESGEVFIGTDNGLVSYKGTATYANSKPNTEVYAYPNPVRPEYNGNIAIKGLTRDALVHITDVSGKVVFSTQSEGGQAIWNGKNAEGNRVASGVYYVFASDKYGKNRSVAKILFIK